jgi:hypothetical protein
MLRIALVIFALAVPAKAEVPVLSYEFPEETFVFPIDLLVGAEANPTLSGEMGLVATFGTGLSLGPVTGRNVGTRPIIRICGEEVSRPVILNEVSGNIALIPLDKPSDAARLAAILNARTCPDRPKE